MSIAALIPVGLIGAGVYFLARAVVKPKKTPEERELEEIDALAYEVIAAINWPNSGYTIERMLLVAGGAYRADLTEFDTSALEIIAEAAKRIMAEPVTPVALPEPLATAAANAAASGDVPSLLQVAADVNLALFGNPHALVLLDLAVQKIATENPAAAAEAAQAA